MADIILQVGINLGVITAIAGILEGIKYYWAGRTLCKRRSSKNYSRKRELWALIFLTPQVMYAYWGLWFPTIHPAWVWAIVLTVTYLGTGTLFYLSCKFKRKDGRFSWPSWNSI